MLTFTYVWGFHLSNLTSSPPRRAFASVLLNGVHCPFSPFYFIFVFSLVYCLYVSPSSYCSESMSERSITQSKWVTTLSMGHTLWRSSKDSRRCALVRVQLQVVCFCAHTHAHMQPQQLKPLTSFKSTSSPIIRRKKRNADLLPKRRFLPALVSVAT